VPDSVNPSLVLGGQGNLWTESVPTGRHAEYMTWPRGLALAEVFWSPEAKQNWTHFQQKLEPHFNRLEAAEINYSRAAFDILADVKRDEKNKLFVSLSTDIDNLKIYYTFNNTNPDSFSNEYNGQPVEIPKGIYQLRAVAFKNNIAVGKILIINREDLEKRAKK
jgi:hexosaminidase